MPQPEKRERDQKIFECWLNGESVKDMAKEYYLTTMRIWQIIREAQKMQDSNDDIKVYLVKKYPDYTKVFISGCVNAVSRNVYIDKRNKSGYRVCSIKTFFDYLDTLTDIDILYMRSIGKKKYEFIHRIRDDWNAEKH